jgi:hypothetical protein
MDPTSAHGHCETVIVTLNEQFQAERALADDLAAAAAYEVETGQTKLRAALARYREARR